MYNLLSFVYFIYLKEYHVIFYSFKDVIYNYWIYYSKFAIYPRINKPNLS
jgi:hypothetical protein